MIVPIHEFFTQRLHICTYEPTTFVVCSLIIVISWCLSGSFLSTLISIISQEYVGELNPIHAPNRKQLEEAETMY